MLQQFNSHLGCLRFSSPTWATSNTRVKVAIRNGDTVIQQEDSDILAINKIMDTLYVHTVNYMYHYAYVYIYI